MADLGAIGRRTNRFLSTGKLHTGGTLRLPTIKATADLRGWSTTQYQREAMAYRPPRLALKVAGYIDSALPVIPVTGVVSGVTEDRGVPIGNKLVFLIHRPTMLVVDRVFSDADGRFEFTGVHAKSQYICLAVDEWQKSPDQNCAVADFITPIDLSVDPSTYGNSELGTGVDLYFANVSALLKFEGDAGAVSFIDSSNYKHPVGTSGSVILSNEQKKFGQTSGYFFGGGLAVQPSSAFTFGTGDFTIEVSCFPLSAPTNNQVIISLCTYPNQDGAFIRHYADGSMQIVVGSYVIYSSPANLLEFGKWTHLAVTRQSSVVRFWVNGQKVFDTVNGFNWYGNVMYVGRPSDYTNYFVFYGYIDEVRITKGVCRYSQDFTAPSVTFPIRGA